VSNRLRITLLLLVLASARLAHGVPLLDPSVTYPVNQEAQTLAIGDLNNDSRDDAAVAAWPSAVYVFYQQEGGDLAAPVQLPSPNMPLGITAGM